MDTQVQAASNPKKRTQDSETVITSLPNDSVNQSALKKRKTKKILISKELAEKRKANLGTRFNSLPKDLKFRILLKLNCYDLIESKEVCSHWYAIIKQLLEVKKVDIPFERRRGPSNYIVSGIHDKISFDVYRTKFRIKYIINRGFIADLRKKKMDCEFNFVTDHDWMFLKLQVLSRNIADCLGRHIGWEDVMWNFVLRLTGEKRSIEELKKEGTQGQFAKYITKRYGWWWWTDAEDLMMGDKEFCGIITLQPDRKTFAILHFPVMELDDDDDYEFTDFSLGCAG